ncbi:MAG TPA: thioesterase family protein [Gemmatimonadaceae bacterium]|nr:thioesterase family protein [Gemmatimonadaceae bacterium]
MRVPLQTRYNDYDARGHVNNAVYLGYFEIGRMMAWQSACSDFEPDFILAEARVAYRSPALIGEPLAVVVTTSEIRTKAWVWSYRIVDERDGRLVADGTTTQVMYDYAIRQTVPIPAALREALGRI